MGPSFSSKNGVRYRFYVSTALRGRKHKAGSVTRISAPEIEGLVETALTEKLQVPRDDMLDHVERITVSDGPNSRGAEAEPTEKEARSKFLGRQSQREPRKCTLLHQRQELTKSF